MEGGSDCVAVQHYISCSLSSKEHTVVDILCISHDISSRVSFCTFLAHEYPDLVHKVVMINGGGPTALEPSLCSIFQLPSCVLHCLSPCLAWSFLK